MLSWGDVWGVCVRGGDGDVDDCIGKWLLIIRVVREA